MKCSICFQGIVMYTSQADAFTNTLATNTMTTKYVIYRRVNAHYDLALTKDDNFPEFDTREEALKMLKRKIEQSPYPGSYAILEVFSK